MPAETRACPPAPAYESELFLLSAPYRPLRFGIEELVSKLRTCRPTETPSREKPVFCNFAADIGGRFGAHEFVEPVRLDLTEREPFEFALKDVDGEHPPQIV